MKDNNVIIYMCVAAVLVALMMAVNIADSKHKETTASIMQESIKHGADPIKVGCGLALAGSPPLSVLNECKKFIAAEE